MDPKPAPYWNDLFHPGHATSREELLRVTMRSAHQASSKALRRGRFSKTMGRNFTFGGIRADLAVQSAYERMRMRMWSVGVVSLLLLGCVVHTLCVLGRCRGTVGEWNMVLQLSSTHSWKPSLAGCLGDSLSAPT